MPKTMVRKKDEKPVEFLVSLWNTEREIKLDFPQECELIECRMAGHGFPPLSDLQIQKAFENAVGAPRIRELARGKQKVVILFDEYMGDPGVPTSDCVEAIKLVARLEGIFLDPVYTGKVMAHLIDLISKKKIEKDEPVVFWHTGKPSAFFSYDECFQ